MSRIFFPLQRVIRTAVQVVVAAASVLAVTVIVAPQIITAVADVLPGPTVAWLTGAVASLAAISAALARIMAIPQVDAFLRKFGAGSSPEGSIVYTDVTGETTPLTRRQFRELTRED